MRSTPPELPPFLAAHNPFDPTQMADPFPFYAAARRATPAFYNAQLQSWMITRPEDIQAIYRDPSRYSSRRIMSTHGELPPEVAAVFEGHDPWLPTLLTTDPPDHTRLRSLLIKGFSPQTIAAREPAIRALADELIDGFIADGHVDVVQRFAFPFTATVIGDMLGIPRADNDQLKTWSGDWIRLIWCVDPLERLVQAAHGLLAFQRYFSTLIAARRERPGSDLLSVLIGARLADGDRLSERELVAVPMQLITGGHETTLYSISNALTLLIQQPQVLAEIRGDLGLLPKLVEESIRHQSPLLVNQRQTLTEVRFGDITIPADSSLMLLIAAANRDEVGFPDPDRFDVHRANADRHFAFGRGIHFCLGAPLARLEMRIALERLLTRLPGLRFHGAQPPTRAPSSLFYGYDHLHLAWDPAPAP